MDNVKNRSILLISHEMSRTGAPVALHYMARQFRNMGMFITVASPKDGPMVEEMLKDNISVIIDGTMEGNTEWLKWGCNFDLIVVNTVVSYHIIMQLKAVDIPVIWWIHDGEMSFRLGANKVLPQTLTDNIHVYGGGEYACRIVKKYRPEYIVNELLYCVPDYSGTLGDHYEYMIDNPEKLLIISVVASIDERKGQDILVEAIRHLKKNEICKCLFLFVGRNNNREIYQKIEKLKEDFPKNVSLISEVSRRQIADVYRQSAAVVCTSRDDPMPVFMTESLMLGIPVICSDHTGTYDLLHDREDGFTFHSGNVVELAERISFVINNRAESIAIGKRGRSIYEKYFTEHAFSEAVNNIVKKYLKI